MTQRAVLTAFSFVLLVVLVGAACGGSEPEREPSLVGMIPAEEAVVLIGDREISGAWLRNMAVAQEVTMRQAMNAPPGVVQVDEWSLIRSTRKMLTQMTLLAMEAERRGLTVSDEEVSARLSEEIEKFDSTEAWRDRLEASGMTVEDRREQLRTELLFQKYRDEVIGPRVREEIAEQKLAEGFYEKYPDLFREPRQVHLFHIFRAVAADAPENERQRERDKLVEARERIEAGEPFEDVAREVSTEAAALSGGDIGWISEQAPLDPEVKDVALALEEGEMSPVVESTKGFHLILATEVKPERQRPVEEAREEIVDKIYREKLTKALAREYDELRLQADIKFLDLEPYLGPKAKAEGGQPAAPAAEPAAQPSAP